MACPEMRSFHFTGPDGPEMTTNGDIKIRVDFHNNSNTKWVSENARLYYEPQTLQHFFATSVPMPESIDAYSEASVTVTLKCMGTATVKTLPNAYKLAVRRITDDTTVQLGESLCRVARHWFGKFVSGLNRFKPNQNAVMNIYLFGPCGAGKSAFLNTLFTMMSIDNNLKPVAVVGGTMGHVTLEFKTYKTQFGFLRICDTFGFDHENFDAEDLRAFLLGEVTKWKQGEDHSKPKLGGASGSSTDSNDKPQKPIRDPGANDITRALRRPHSVLFFVPQSLAMDALLPRVQKHMEVFTACGLNPVVLVARADEVDDGIRQRPNEPSPDLTQALKDIAKTFAIPENSVFPCVPYLLEEERSFEIERLAYRILEEAMVRGYSRVDQLLSDMGREDSDDEDYMRFEQEAKKTAAQRKQKIADQEADFEKQFKASKGHVSKDEDAFNQDNWNKGKK